ncbi:hypothetical protein HDZ31DRAFT_3756, partial [Schizophyllum fasciatum]
MAGYRLPTSSPLESLVRKTSQRRADRTEPVRPPRPPGSPLIRTRFDQARDDESVYTDAGSLSFSSSSRPRHAHTESKASTSYAGSSYSIYPADASLEHYPPFAAHEPSASVDSYIDMNSPVDDEQPLADAEEAVLAGLGGAYRDERRSAQAYGSALRDSWPDAKRAVPGRQDADAFRSVYSNVDSVYSQDADADDGLPTVVVSSPAPGSGPPAGRQPIVQQPIRNFSRPMPQPSAPLPPPPADPNSSAPANHPSPSNHPSPNH